MSNLLSDRDTLLAPIAIMADNGVPFRSFVDVGSADGTFGLTVLDTLGPALQLLNIDAQDTYSASLQRIYALLGEPYRITALSDHIGTLKVRKPQHEYWLSTAQGGDHEIPCTTLDAVWREANLAGPCFIKIDVEGAEMSVLKGADETLKDCAGLLIESPVRDAKGPQFLELYAHLAARGFLLFDMVRRSYRGSDATMYQFYSVFIAERFDFRASKPLRSNTQQAEVLTAVQERRAALLSENTALMASIKLKRAGL